MSNLSDRVETAVSTMESNAEIAKKFVDVENTEVFDTGKGMVIPIGKMQRDAAEGIEQIRQNANTDIEQIKQVIESDVSQLQQDVEADISQLQQNATSAIEAIVNFREEVFIPGKVYVDRKINFINGGIAYIPIDAPYTAGASLQDDIDIGVLTIMQGLMHGDVGEAAFKRVGKDSDDLPAASDSVVVFDSLVPESIGGSDDNAVSADAVVGQRLSTRGYYGTGTGGSGDYIVVLPEGSADGGSLLDMLNGLQLKLVLGEKTLDVGMFGINDQVVVDKTSMYQAVINYAKSIGVRRVKTDVIETTNLSSLKDSSNVDFYGSGSLGSVVTEVGQYRCGVSKGGSLNPKCDPPFLISNPKTSMKVVVMGDSLTTFGAEALNYSDVLYSYLTDKMRADNPDVDFEFVGRGIGGQTYLTADSLPSTSNPKSLVVEWYADDNKLWLDYVADESPDLVVLSFGMNDKSLFDPASFVSVLSKIAAMGAEPVVITNMVPNRSPSEQFSYYSSYLEQEGRDAAAGWMRTYCQFYGIPFIDINRTFNIVRDGRDVLDTELSAEPEEDLGFASQYVAPANKRCRDFAAKVLVDVTAWGNEQPFYIKLSQSYMGDCVVFIVDDGGFIRFKFYGGHGKYIDELSSIPTPQVTGLIEVSVKSNMFSFKVRASNQQSGSVQPYVRKIIRFGGLLDVKMGYFGSEEGPVRTVLFMPGVDKKFDQVSTDEELWGVVSSNAGQRPETGGNGINHLSSHGGRSIYGAHFSAQVMRLQKRIV